MDLKQSRVFAWAILLAMALIAASCSFELGSPAISTPTPAATTPTAVVSPTPTPDASNPSDETATPDSVTSPESAAPDSTPEPDEAESAARLVVQDDNYQLFTVAADGSDRVDLTDDDGTVNSQPTWSPDGNFIAWTNLDLATGTSIVKTDRFDRTEPRERSVLSPPFYLSWDGSSSQIAYLAPSRGGIDFGVIDMTEEGRAIRYDRGEPFFFSWGPLGDELLVHASDFRLDRIDISDGTVDIISEFPGSFQTPVWLGSSQILVFADVIEGDNYLVTSGTVGENVRPLATYDGNLILTVSPDDTRIAMQATPRAADPGIVTASFTPASFTPASPAQLPPTPDPLDPFADPIDELFVNALMVMNVFGGEAFPISFEPAAGFYWSPDGQTLAYLVNGTEPGSLQWRFWNALIPGETFFGPTFVPSDTFAFQYLPFFDQYEQSIDFWSPEGDRIVYAGTDVLTDESGIFSVEPLSGLPPTFLIEGEIAAWSPVSAGGAASRL